MSPKSSASITKLEDLRSSQPSQTFKKLPNHNHAPLLKERGSEKNIFVQIQPAIEALSYNVRDRDVTMAVRGWMHK
jgi:hypothetical protein